MISIGQGISIMLPRIDSQTRHEFYDRTVDRRKLYHAMMTGDDIESYLMRFERRETAEQFNLRKRVTQQCVSPAINEAAAQFYKTSRYPNIKKEISYKTDSGKLARLEEALKTFCYGGDVQSYLALEFDRRSLIDPNAFLVIDFSDFDAMQNQKPGCYGVFVPCDNVVDFEFLPNDELNYLIIERGVEIFDKDGLIVKLKDYIGYLGNEILIYEEIHEDRRLLLGETVSAGATSYNFRQLESAAGQVQAYRLGYIKDPITNYRTVISPLDTAETVVMDLNNDKSNYDQTKMFHCFPQKFAFEKPCPGVDSLTTCNHGFDPAGNKCAACHGSGILIHESASDVITFPLPTDSEDYPVKLSEMVHYAEMSIDIIKHLREDLEGSKMGIMRAIFNTESAVKTDGKVKVENTATEFTIKADDKNNTLLPFCEHKSKFYKFIVRQIALFNDLADGLQILFEYPASLRLETVEELQAKFATLVNANASPTLLDDIEKEIASKRFVDDPEGLKKYEIWKMHRPFRNRPSTEVEFAIGNGSVPKYLEVLWASYEQIMTELENENSGFYNKAYAERAKLIKERAQQYVAELEPAVPEGGFLNQPKVPLG
ncbi:hypothetical protein DYBT9275_02757 [Dyadobacter sp. CECT 9275]|uniref:Uncharacterized protein n=1 Tax=Dyadobacter helix TaxID=2822344 RepID=A0A916JCP0_9BACT|nr:hypothetical protein [Dyadobacter sp. CECT 9275]CAG5001867.1 hypothetical protein DYBT9275_02757 [Dyadobacter sp. CECT 9275]